LTVVLKGSSLTEALRDVERSLSGGDIGSLEVSVLSWDLPPSVTREILRVASNLVSYTVRKARLGLFVVFTGLDKTGKETQLFNPAHRPGIIPLQSYLTELGYQVLGVRLPSYDTPLGRLVAAHLGRAGSEVQIEGQLDRDAAWVLWSLDRAQHSERVASWLTMGPNHIVLSKRWTESNVVYQAVLGIDPKRILSVESNIVKQDITVVMDAPVGVVLGRLATQYADAYEHSTTLGRAGELYARLDELYPFGRIYHVDANADPPTVNGRLIELVKRLVKPLRDG
jgi:dTMP kinase